MVTDVLRAKKDSVGQVFEKHPRLNQSGHGLEPKAADRSYSFVYFAQLRNSIGSEVQLFQTLAIFSTGMLLMRRLQRFPDRRPNLMLLGSIRSIRNGVAGVILHRDLRDLIAPAAILGITKAGMVRIELHDRISIGNGVVQIARDEAGVNMIEQ